MAVTLTTVFNPGDLDPNQTYAKARIVSFQWGDGGITVQWVYGNYVDGAWVTGTRSPARKAQITGADYETLVASASTASGEVYYDQISNLLYQYLIDHGLLIGTVDPS